MKANVAIISLIIVALSVNHLSGQEADSARVITQFRIDEVSKAASEISMDTSRMELFRYNPIKKKSFTNTFLGNSGMASQSNFFWQRKSNANFIFARPYEVYLYHPYNTPHFNTRKPYTELKYLTSGGRDDSEQFLSALHTQNINQYANIGLFYDLIASKGVYQRQNLGSNHFNFFGSYRKNNYQMFTSINTNKIQAQENGGLSSISDFKEQLFDAVNYDVRLDNASSVLKYYSFFVTQKLDILRIQETDTSDVVRKTPFSLQHTLAYDRYVKNYNDQINPGDTSRVYRNNYLLINEASDSAFHHRLSNRFSLNLAFAKETQRLQLFLKHEYKSYAFKSPAAVSYSVNDQTKDTVLYQDHQDNYHDVSLGGQYFGTIGNWEYDVNGSIFMTGYRQNDIAADVNFIRYLNDKTNKVALRGHFSSLRPDYFMMRYGSAHFIWDNEFRNTDNFEVMLDYTGKRSFNVKAVLNYYTGYTYFDEMALPRQLTDQLVVGSLLIDKSFSWGGFHHRHQILLQKPTGDVINLPLLAYGNTTYYQNALFNNELKFQLGWDFTYTDKYYGDAYMPATGIFYNQHEEKIGQFPFLDAFVNLKIKRTRFTFQYTNALAGLAGTDYFKAYRYPTFGGRFKFGLAWTFYN